jgi:uroporphyrin-III C-methyltransferase/precorrin-2 dehydrogenase/sirohydrochlorin ferrochelatase
MDYLPLFARLKNRTVLLVGGGDIALRKARLLLDAGAVLTVIAPSLHEELTELLSEQHTYIPSRFNPAHLNNQMLVIAATDDEDVNAEVAAAADAANIWVNVVDDPDRSSFIFPSIIDRSPIMVAVSSGGKAPVLVRMLRERLEALLPKHLGALGNLSGEWRSRIKQKLGDITSRRRFWEKAFASPQLATLLETEQQPAAEQWMEQQLNAESYAGGEIVLVGAGPGDGTLQKFEQIFLFQRFEHIKLATGEERADHFE